MIYVPIMAIIIFLGFIFVTQYVNEMAMDSLNEQFTPEQTNQSAVGNETAAQNESIEQNETMKKISEEFFKINENFNFFASLLPIIVIVVLLTAALLVLPRVMHGVYDFEPPIYSYSSSTSIDDDASIGDGTQPIKVEVSKPIVQQEPVKKKDKHELHIDEQMEAWTASHSDMSPKMLRGQRMLFKKAEYKTRKRRKPRKPAETKISPVESNTPYGK